MHNLSTVLRFEVTRTLKKKSFWIMAIGFPLMFAAIFGIIFLANKSTDEASKNLEKQKFSVEVTDESQLVAPKYLEALSAKRITNKQAGIANVRDGKIDAYFYYPKDLEHQPIEVYGKDVGLFDNGRYSTVAKTILSLSVEETVTPAVRIVVKNATNVQAKTFREGKEYDGFKQMILPGVFLVLFYILIAFFGNQMLTSTTEEKENRVIEMLLTTVEARTLIIGKILSLILLSLVQGMIIVLPALAGYLLLHDKLSLPSVDLSALPVDWSRIGVGAAIFAASFLLFTGLLVAIGSSVPTAKEAGGFLGIVMMLIFGPLYAASLFVSSPESPFVRFLTLFPFTAPIPMMLRNAVGNLEPWEAIVGITVLIISAAIIMLIAVRVFRYGALEYSRKLSLREIFSRS
jgi:ABC-2 type transport system permease protein